MARVIVFAVSVAAMWLAPIAAADNARLMEQLTQFNGGCPPNDGCSNLQFSVHRAPVCVNGPDSSVSATYSVSMVRQAAPGLPLRGGSSTLVRATDGVAFDFSTGGLEPEAPFTMWWVAFNPDNPCISDGADCTCGGPDLRPGEDSVLFAAGTMSDLLGNAHFTGSIAYGEVPSGPDQATAMNAPIEAGAEIHLVIRGHGPALNGNGGASSGN